MTTIKQILTLFLMTLTAQVILASPIVPQTLKTLIEDSQYIVIATVDNPEKSKNTPEDSNFGKDRLVQLNIKEVLKGQLSNSLIQVAYDPTVVCPAPPRYPDKNMVMAFLYKKDTDATYRTVGLSYGSKVVDNEDELTAYRARILEYLEILKESEEQKRKEATVEWLVKCAENKFTLWEGAYELARISGHGEYKSSKAEQLRKFLTNAQIQRIEKVFFTTDTLSENELYLTGLISKENRTKLKDRLLKNLKYSDNFLSLEIMKKVLEIVPDEKLESIYDELYDLILAEIVELNEGGKIEEDKHKQQQLLMDEFRNTAQNMD